MDKSIIPFSPKNGVTDCMVGIEVLLIQRRKLNTVSFYITDYGEPATPFSMRIFIFDNSDQPRGEFYLKQNDSYSSPHNGNQWIILKLEDENIWLEKGKYLIAMSWLKEPGSEGLTAQTIGFEENHHSEPKSWMNWRGERHSWQKDTGPYRGNFMIEADFNT